MLPSPAWSSCMQIARGKSLHGCLSSRATICTYCKLRMVPSKADPQGLKSLSSSPHNNQAPSKHYPHARSFGDCVAYIRYQDQATQSPHCSLRVWTAGRKDYSCLHSKRIGSNYASKRTYRTKHWVLMLCAEADLCDSKISIVRWRR